MSRLIQKRIQVTSLVPDTNVPPPDNIRPAGYTLRGGRYRVVQDQDVNEAWEEVGRWWEKEPTGQGWRVRLSSGGVVELLLLRKDLPEWWLMKAYD